MPRRSGMAAAWRILAILGVGMIVFGAPARPAPAVEPASGKVTLVINIAGIGQQGCEVEIRPGHPACKFEPLTRKAPRSGKLQIDNLQVKTSSADRDCSFKITLKEPGLTPKSVIRGIRLDRPAADAPAKIQTMTCYLMSPSLAIKDDPAIKRK